MKIKDLNVLVIRHYFDPTGEAGELVEYLRDKVHALTYIEHPFSFSKKSHSSVTMYKRGRVEKTFRIFKPKGPEVISYAVNLLSTLYFVLRTKAKFDVCVAADNLNALSGLLLKKIGIVKKVIFYTVDYTPKRFDNNLLNGVYYWLDMICCHKCDFVWNTTEVMEIERRKRGIIPGKSAPQIVVPNGTNFGNIKRLSINEINRFDLVFLGRLIENKGVQLIIEAFPTILKRVPNARLIIIGTGPLEEKLKRKVRALGLEEQVEFKGFIDNHKEIEGILSRCAVGLAPYSQEPGNLTYYSDPAKPKVYMATGLPVVITRVPKIAFEIDRNRAGFTIDYDQKQLIDATVKLLTDDNLYRKFRENAITLASHFTWSRVFQKAFLAVRVDFNV